MRHSKKVTLDDIARDSGVSRSTVAMVLREGTLITPATKQKVWESAERLGYTRKPPAEAPDRSKANIIGVLFPDIGNIFFTSLFIGVNEFFDQYEEYTIFFNNHFDSIEKQRRFLDNLPRERLAGLVMAPSIHTRQEEIEELQAQGIPIVFVGRTVEGPPVSYVGGDDRAGAYDATRHLLDYGHRRISLFGGVKGLSHMEQRREGYEQALAEAGIPLDPALILTGPVSSAWAQWNIQRMMELPEPPTAVICYSDVIAEGVIRGLELLNLIPGQDVSVIKFDYALDQEIDRDENVSAVHFSSLYYSSHGLRTNFTSVREDIYQVGYEAAKLLFRHIVGLSKEPEKIIFPMSLIVRNSSGPVSKTE